MLDNAIDAGMEARHYDADTEARHYDADTEARHYDSDTEARHYDADTEARHTEEKQWRAMLRNKKINYSKGIFFVTSQAAFNKSIFGAIVGQRCELNELGRAVHESLGSLGGRYKGVEVIEYTVMPNHIHALIRIAGMEARHTDAGMEARHTDAGMEARHTDADMEARHSKVDLGMVVGRFKSWTSKVYRDLKEAGRAVDVGTTPWQHDYWDKLVSTDEQLEAVRRYIRENPQKWTSDRFGAVTSFARGNIALLSERLVGFVASQGALAADLEPRLLWRKGDAGMEARHCDAGMEARHYDADTEARHTDADMEARHSKEKPPVISTFTSAQERAVFAKILASRRRFVKLYPGGIPEERELPPEIVAACAENRGLLLSPVASGTGINKQRAIWCNEYVIRHANEIWAGDITPGHTLASIVAALAP